MPSRARLRLGALAVLPVLLLVPALEGPTTTRPVIRGGAVPAYGPPVAGEVARSFDRPDRQWEAGHRGLDLWSALGAVVRSPGPGVVTFAGSVAGKPVVVVTHPDGLRSSLEPVVASLGEGTVVQGGTVVGRLSATAGNESNPDHCAGLAPTAPAAPTATAATAATAAHAVPAVSAAACVHWGVPRGDLYVDPLMLLGEAPPIVLLPPR